MKKKFLLALLLSSTCLLGACAPNNPEDPNENPPINENMIRALYMQMGRKPSEAQIRQIMNSVNKQKK